MVLAVGSRLQDFTTGSWALFKAEGVRIVGLNTQAFDAGKHRALPLVADARVGLEMLDAGLGDWRTAKAWTDVAASARAKWLQQAKARDRSDQRPALRCAGDRRGGAGEAARA